MSIVLGINAFHADASACLLRDGKIVAAIAEERLGDRRKHHAGFPTLAIRAVLDAAKADISEVSHVAVGHNPRANALAKARYALRNPVRVVRGALTFGKRSRKLLDLHDVIAETCGFPRESCDFDVNYVEHHLAHIASSYYLSPFDSAAGFSYDGSGDFVSAMLARCEGNRIEVLQRRFLPHSLGIFYTAICQHIGFEKFGEEYKVMGLASYGVPRFQKEMQELLTADEDGLFSLSPEYFATLTGTSFEFVDERGEIILPPLFSPKMTELLGPPRERGTDVTQREMDIAASCQAHFEDVVLHCLRALQKLVPTDALVTAGGCALNGVCNARILRESSFKRSYIHGAAADDGTAVGAALWTWHNELNLERTPEALSSYWGSPDSMDSCEVAVKASGLAAEKLDRAALIERVVDLLANGAVIGWCQGRSEWGPRALGNRSIVAHPGWPGMKDLINAKVKRREKFRPFAPSILAERVGDYFEEPVLSPFMMHVVPIREERRGELAAVTHVDGTGRLQTVSREQNDLYYDLIKRFGERTGTPVLLNTSFNENEPIVELPEQALGTFLRTDLDAIAVGPYLIVK